MQTTEKPGWNPYLAGALSGLVAVLSVGVAGKFYGASTTFTRSSGMIYKLFASERVEGMEYYLKVLPTIDWQWMFVVGIFLGAWLAARLGGDFRWQALPPMWERRFGPGLGKRGVTAFIGGLIMMFGARMAGGCPSGHGLSGSLQLAVSGLIALICFFIAGMVMARLLYGSGRP